MPDKPTLTLERMQLLITVSNRLLFALGSLGALLIPGAFITYWFGAIIVGAVPLMTLLVGALGGFVGLQKRLNQLPNEELTLLSKSWVFTLLSPLVGGILATLVYVMFISGLLTGDLFPKFVSDKLASNPQGLEALFNVHGQAADYAKLIFWCFLAGYSERFATDVLAHFESIKSTTTPSK
jgi:hypothetical protein